MNVFVVIPALNEGENIGRIAQETLPQVSQLIVVDNGSTDDTAIVARNAGARVISEPRRGYGFACAAGSAAAIAASADVIS